jgi:fatty-acyl-CoA synthase
LVETRVVDPEMNDTSPNETGEIVHRSPQLMVGYWEKPEETEQEFEGGWFHSGDLGYFNEEGYLYVVDRVKDVINTGVVQVSGRDVEDALFEHEAVSEVAVIGLPDEKWIEAVSAVVVPREDAEWENLREALEEHAREKLAYYKRPNTSSSWRICRATPPARSSNASCGRSSPIGLLPPPRRRGLQE